MDAASFNSMLGGGAAPISGSVALIAAAGVVAAGTCVAIGASPINTGMSHGRGPPSRLIMALSADTAITGVMLNPVATGTATTYPCIPVAFMAR